MTKGKHFLSFFQKFRVRAFFALVLFGVVPSLLFLFLFLQIYVSRSVQSDVTELTSSGHILNKQIVTSGYLTSQDSDTIEEQIRVLSQSYGGRIMLVDDTLTIVKDTYNVDEGKTIIWNRVVETFGGESTYLYEEDAGYLVVCVPIVSESDDTVVGVLMMNKSMTYIDTAVEYFESVFAWFFLVWLLVSVIIAVILSAKMARPYQKFTTLIKDVDRGVADTIPEVLDYAETRELSASLNSLLNRLHMVDESRQEFVSNVSHELKTPLTSMKVLADSLNGQENVPVELYQEFMADIGTEIDRETQIINDLLSMVKMDQSQASLNISAVNMNELIELILKRLKPIAEKNHIELLFESFRPVTADVDEVKITLAISNLIENGIKYNEEGGWVHVTLNADHEYCYIKVEDSGMGIPEESLEHVFERFYRVDKSHSREIGGTGLGLAIVKSVITLHQGEIMVHSNLGEGTMFDVRLPLSYISGDTIG